MQLPPKLVFEASLARRFFRQLHKRIDVPIACEPRHPSWASQRAASVLNDCAVARVAADPSLWPGADEPGGYEQLAYFRWHGQPRKYYSDYDRERLECLWRQLAVASRTARQVWSIFDNTVLGYAFWNALATTDASEKSTLLHDRGQVSKLRTKQQRETLVDPARAGATRPASSHHALRACDVRFDVSNLLCGQVAAEHVEVRFVVQPERAIVEVRRAD